MASGRDFLEFLLDQLSGLGEVTYKAMMGEFIIYYRGKIVGGIFDDSFLVKNIPAAAAMMPEAELTLPYEGGTPMLLVDDVDNRAFLAELLRAMYPELPEPKQKVPKKTSTPKKTTAAKSSAQKKSAEAKKPSSPNKT